MDEIKKLYVLEWYGPYESIEDIWNDSGTEDCSIYLITGKEKYERGQEHIKYVGITERYPAKRLSDKDHREKQQLISYKKYWVGRFSRSSHKNSRLNAELIENLFVHYLYISGERIINDKKLKKVPEVPLTVVNRWLLKNNDLHRVNKPNRLSSLPDVLLFDGSGYWGAEKLKYLNNDD